MVLDPSSVFLSFQRLLNLHGVCFLFFIVCDMNYSYRHSLFIFMQGDLGVVPPALGDYGGFTTKIIHF